MSLFIKEIVIKCIYDSITGGNEGFLSAEVKDCTAIMKQKLNAHIPLEHVFNSN